MIVVAIADMIIQVVAGALVHSTSLRFSPILRLQRSPILEHRKRILMIKQDQRDF